ncbi:hypothetical protein HPB51_021400 [Rhipicephalus microplus]|uniref:Uncharacterized protein n=1 Tax=Rhipicephalus microplus TaxID=6941 RepID=A0A9J6F8B5_RHIMP|nr:hypothetical protein HPB51_021400 [Rhipicephalus microplus]
MTNVTTVARVYATPTPSDLASVISQVVHEELDRREAASVSSLQVREPLPPCDPGVTSINAASVDAYNFAPRPMIPSPTMSAHLGYEVHDGFACSPPAVFQPWVATPFILPLAITACLVSSPSVSNLAVVATSPNFCPQRHHMSAPSDHALYIAATVTMSTELTGLLALIAGRPISRLTVATHQLPRGA